MLPIVIADLRYKVNRNQGEQWDADQYHEHALDGKGIAKFAHKHRIQGVDESAVEISAEVHQAKGDENFPIDP